MEMPRTDLGQTEKILPLPDPDDHPDPGGEADDHRIGDELDDGAEAGDAEEQQHGAGHHGGDLQAVHTVFGGDPRENHDEGAGRSGNLQTAAAQQGDQQAADDRGVDALFRLDPGGDGKRHGQGQRDDPDDHAGHQVTCPVFPSEQPGLPRFAHRNHDWLLNQRMCMILSCSDNDRRRARRNQREDQPVLMPCQGAESAGILSKRVSADVAW
ncbi:hypothetical protein D3C84_587380 [compost metagenome]